MEKKIKLSVIIPVYNVAQYLRDCMDSVIHQTLKDIQIICVNDGSTDGSLSILEEYQNKDSRIELITQENQGLSGARNTGVKASTGDYLYFLDSDDWIEKDALQKIYEKGSSQDLDVVYFLGKTFHDGLVSGHHLPTYEKTSAYFKENTNPMKGSEFFELLYAFSEYNPVVWLQGMKRSYYLREHLSFYQGIYHEDNLFTFQNLFSAERVGVVPEYLYHYRVRENSITTIGKEQKHLEGILVCYLEILLFLQKKKLNSVVISQFLYKMRKNYGNLYEQVTGDSGRKGIETLWNMERCLFGEPLLTLWGEEEVRQLGESPFLFFGAGIYGEKMLTYFKEELFPLPKAICDNNQKIQGQLLMGVPILSLEQAMATYPDACILVTNERYYVEITNQIKETLGEEKIIFFER